MRYIDALYKELRKDRWGNFAFNLNWMNIEFYHLYARRPYYLNVNNHLFYRHHKTNLTKDDIRNYGKKSQKVGRSMGMGDYKTAIFVISSNTIYEKTQREIDRILGRIGFIMEGPMVPLMRKSHQPHSPLGFRGYFFVIDTKNKTVITPGKFTHAFGGYGRNPVYKMVLSVLSRAVNRL
jgi:hypothetical protein